MCSITNWDFIIIAGHPKGCLPVNTLSCQEYGSWTLDIYIYIYIYIL